jgi:hypothetical protein
MLFVGLNLSLLDTLVITTLISVLQNIDIIDSSFISPYLSTDLLFLMTELASFLVF